METLTPSPQGSGPSKVDVLEDPLLPLKYDGSEYDGSSTPRMSARRLVRNALVIILLSGVIIAASWILSTLPDPEDGER